MSIYFNLAFVSDYVQVRWNAVWLSLDRAIHHQMKGKNAEQSPVDIVAQLFIARGKRAMLDSELACVYGVSTCRLDEAVKRNLRRFPEDFSFVLTDHEVKNLMPQIAKSVHRARRHHGGVGVEQPTRRANECVCGACLSKDARVAAG